MHDGLSWVGGVPRPQGVSRPNAVLVTIGQQYLGWKTSIDTQANKQKAAARVRHLACVRARGRA